VRCDTDAEKSGVRDNISSGGRRVASDVQLGVNEALGETAEDADK
jgi:hypothetical protein